MPTHGNSKKQDKIHNIKLLIILLSDLTPIKSWLKHLHTQSRSQDFAKGGGGFFGSLKQ